MPILLHIIYRRFKNQNFREKEILCTLILLYIIIKNKVTEGTKNMRIYRFVRFIVGCMAPHSPLKLPS